MNCFLHLTIMIISLSKSLIENSNIKSKEKQFSLSDSESIIGKPLD